MLTSTIVAVAAIVVGVATFSYDKLVIFLLFLIFSKLLFDNISKHKGFLKDESVLAQDLPHSDHDKRRWQTYPEPVANAWYAIADETELNDQKVVEVRALGQTFAVWMSTKGPVCQDAFCLHMGANLAVGGKVVDDCVECPFHRWKFSNDGSIKEIPYITDPKNCPKHPKLKTYPCESWCGIIFVYFDAENRSPAFELPKFVPEQFKKHNWKPHLKWDIGHKRLTACDWVEQAGDHAHFHTLHNEFVIPWTTIPIPSWLMNIFPIGIAHRLVTYLGDDQEWKNKIKMKILLMLVLM